MHTAISGQAERGGRMEAMGMTDKQFDAFVRLLLDNIRETLGMMEEGEAKKKLEKIEANLQQTLES